MNISKVTKNYMEKNFKELKNRVFIISLIISLTLSTIVLYSFSEANKNQFTTENGVLDLTNWNMEKDSIVSLDGEWEFYWNQLLTYKDFEAGKLIKPDGYFKVPDVWTNYNLNNKSFPEFGYATYRLKVKTNDIETLKGIKILTASTAYKLMIDDQVISKNGIVGKTKETSVSEFRPKTVSFKNTSKEFYIIVQVSNYEYSRGGLWYSMYLGNDEQIRTFKELDSGKDMFMFGVVMVMSLYHMTLFVLRKRDKTFLYFSLILLIMGIRFTITDEYIINNFIHVPSLKWMVTVEYLTMYWGIIMTIAFIHALFPEEISQKTIKIIIYAGLAVSIFTIVTPMNVFTRYLIFYEIAIVITYGYSIFLTLRAAMKRREGAFLMLLSSVVVLVVFINDVLYQWNIILSKYGTSIEAAVCIFSFLESYILARRSSVAFEEAENLSEKLVSLDQLKDEFLANTSHELRMPLNGIINISESILRGVAGKLNFKQEENIQVILSAARRSYNLIDDILDSSSLKHNQIKLYKKSVNASMVVDLVMFVLRNLNEDKNIIFENFISKDTPAIFCDEERLIQIFYNLIENVIKFSEKGHIIVNAKYSASEVTIFIENIGIEANNLEKFLNCFDKANILKNNKFEKEYIGLSITKRLIEIQEGNMGIKSENGKGSYFFCTFPIAKDKLEDNMKNIEDAFELESLEEKDTINKKEELDKYNILVVEHDEMSFKALINNLALSNYTVKGVTNGYESLKLVEDGIKFDIVILNIMMPDISGYKILNEIRKKYLPLELPVLMLRSRRHYEDISTGFKLGANDYLAKPFESEELIARVDSLINMKKAVNSLVASELSFLQAQIKPHFIFNALSVISSLSLKKPAQAKELILDLSDYLRGSFDFESDEGMTTLQMELKLVKAYIAIEQARFKERICVDFDIDDIDCVIPMLTIQPLVENAVGHGILSVIRGGKIWVKVKRQGQYVKISIRDNGVGIDEERVENILSVKSESGSGSVGMKNVHRRLMKLYGRGISVKKVEEKGTIVEFTIPYEV